jgi:CRP/FNR family transcriptional regulator, cyclic AMP receptor protein
MGEQTGTWYAGGPGPRASALPSYPFNGRRTERVPEPGDLAEFPLFRGLTPGQLSKLSALLRYKRCPTRTEIITIDQPGEMAYVILDGSVKIHIDQPDGSDVILAILGADEIVGEMSLADSLGRSASVTTLEPTTLLMIERSVFWASLREMSTLTYNLVSILSRRLRLANLHTQSLARLDVYGRVAAQIAAFAREYGKAAPNGGVLIPLSLTQSDLAGMVGASRVRVNQALSYFKRRNYLSVDDDRHIVVHDVAALDRRCN